jgi:Leucine-rich repeat (LRR) protein
MTEISIQNNPITHLTGFAFAGLRNVTNLYLGYNRLKRIDG